MKILFLNVWGDHMRDDLIPYLKEQTADTDIFCFQEATDEMKRRCADVLEGYAEISDFKYMTDENNFSVATFVKKGIEVRDTATLLMDRDGCGLALYTEVIANGQSIHICNVHGDALPHHKLDSPGRLVQSQEIIDFFKDKTGPIVIAGDFNIELETKSETMFAENGYRDLIKEFTIDTTRNRLAWDRFPVPMYYSDYAFVNDHVQLEHFEVTKNEVSDHLPLSVRISV